MLSSIIVHPATLNDPQSNNAFKILVAVRVFAKVLELQVRGLRARALGTGPNLFWTFIRAG